MYTLMTRRWVEQHDRYGYPTGRWNWSRWTILGGVASGKVAEKLAFWRELNDHAVRERWPQNTRREFRVVEGHVDDWDKWEATP